MRSGFTYTSVHSMLVRRVGPIVMTIRKEEKNMPKKKRKPIFVPNEHSLWRFLSNIVYTRTEKKKKYENCLQMKLLYVLVGLPNCNSFRITIKCRTREKKYLFITTFTAPVFIHIFLLFLHHFSFFSSYFRLCFDFLFTIPCFCVTPCSMFTLLQW